MSAPSTLRIACQAGKNTARLAGRARRTTLFPQQTPRLAAFRPAAQTAPCFSTSTHWRAGLMPETEDPQPPSRVEEARVKEPAPIDDEEYHARADEYMEVIHEKAEEIQESREDVEVEYSAGVLSINLPPNGTYIINKQPPNKQIWLSSPLSGPKRYDWVLEGEGIEEKQGGGEGNWVYLRDGSNLTELLRKEVGITVSLHKTPEEMEKGTTESAE